jgi:hypothetical protein
MIGAGRVGREGGIDWLAAGVPLTLLAEPGDGSLITLAERRETVERLVDLAPSGMGQPTLLELTSEGLEERPLCLATAAPNR